MRRWMAMGALALVVGSACQEAAAPPTAPSMEAAAAAERPLRHRWVDAAGRVHELTVVRRAGRPIVAWHRVDGQLWATTTFVWQRRGGGWVHQGLWVRVAGRREPTYVPAASLQALAQQRVAGGDAAAAAEEAPCVRELLHFLAATAAAAAACSGPGPQILACSAALVEYGLALEAYVRCMEAQGE